MHQHRTHPLEIAVNNVEPVEVGHTRHDFRELDFLITGNRIETVSGGAYQSKAVCFWIGFCILYHIPIGHPLCEDAETVWIRGRGNAE